MMRRYHRWVSFPLILFLFAVTLTGIYLQFLEASASFADQPSAPTRSVPDDVTLTQDLLRTLASARAQRPGFPLQKIELSYTANGLTARLATNARIGPSMEVDVNAGTVKYEERPKRTLRTTMILLHSGKYFGFMGIAIMLLASIALLVLCVTGIVVYVDMFNRRRRAGKMKFFWK